MSTEQIIRVIHKWDIKIVHVSSVIMVEKEKNELSRRKCTEFTAWKLSMQAIRQKKKEDKDKYYSTTKGKLYKRNLMKQKGGRKIW